MLAIYFESKAKSIKIDIFDTSVEMKLFFARVVKVENRGAAKVYNTTSAEKA